LGSVTDEQDDRISTGIPEIDRALEWGNPLPALVEYFDRRWTRDGQDAVIQDLEQSLTVLPPGSPAQSGMSAWLADAREGKRPA
jgi:hypothetical protein